MKKFLMIAALFTVVGATQVNAQGGQQQDPAARMEKMKERMKPELIEKAHITDAQADKVLEISMDYRQKMRGLRELPDNERKPKYEQLMVEQSKAFKAIPLTDEQLVAVNTYFSELRQKMNHGPQNGAPQN